jgi:methyltransferase (TIGR00027 family)
MALLRPDERAIVEEVRAGVPPAGWGPRLTFAMVNACGEVMAPRTITIDDAVREALRAAPGEAGRTAAGGAAAPNAAGGAAAPNAAGGAAAPNAADGAAAPPSTGGAAAASTQVVILGAGLDGRAWRLPELAGTPVFEVDHPASQRDKRARARELVAAGEGPTYVAVDFSRDDLAAVLAAAGHRRTAPTIWIWEGVVPYLTRGEVTRTLRTIAHRSAPGSRMIMQYHPPTPSSVLGRWTAGVLSRLFGRESPMTREPNRSAWTPRAMNRTVRAHGFTVRRDDTLLSLARRFATPVRHRRSMRDSRILVADHDRDRDKDRASSPAARGAIPLRADGPGRPG